MTAVDGDRLLADLRTLRTFGARGNGVVRRALSPVDVESRRWLAARMAEAGLDARIDGIGTVLGRSRNPGPALLIGSHSDTQPTGGWLDGAMGVIYGLEIARAFAENAETVDLAVDVVSWIDEEGAFSSLMGSRAYCGELPADAFTTLTDESGRRLGDALHEAGFAGAGVARLEPDRYAGYLEAHIEQGPYLEIENRKIGVVTVIVGIRDYAIRFEGEQNHAGTTPMALRKDAGMALIRLAHEFDAAFGEAAGPRTVWTFGKAAFKPGAASIVPGRAELIVQFRDPDETRLDRFEAILRRRVVAADGAGPVGVELAPLRDGLRPAAMDAGLQAHLADAAERHAPGAWMRLPSGAGHDAQILARRLPAAMLFVPSIAGVSHSFAEDTAPADIVLGCRVLASAAEAILLGRRGS